MNRLAFMGGLFFALQGCCPCTHPLPDNIAHALSEPYQAPKPFTGDLNRLAVDIHARYLHKFKYAHSGDLYGSATYWPTPAETRAKRKADCKGFAVAGYYDALRAGVPVDKLSIWIVVYLPTGEQHAVLIIGDYIVDRMFADVFTVEQSGNVYVNILRFNHDGWTEERP